MMREMKVVLAAAGSRGDLIPFSALAEELASGGHETILVSHASMANLAPATSTFIPVDSDPHALLNGEAGEAVRRLNPRRVNGARQVFADFLHAFHQPTASAVRDADVLVGSTFATPSVHAALQQGVPVIRAHTWPQPRYEGVEALLPGGWRVPHPLRGTVNRAVDRFGTYAGGVEGEWRGGKLHLTVRHPVSFSAETIGSLHAYSPLIAAAEGNDACVTGWWNSPVRQDVSERTRHLLRTPGPWVTVGFGSMPTGEFGPWLQMLDDVAERAGVRILLQAPGQGPVEGDRVHVIGEEPHDALFPLVDAVVHHGGSGTCGAVLRSGVPCVVVPFFGDQFYWAHRLRQLGVAPKPIYRPLLNTARLADRITKALSPEKSTRAEELRKAVAEEPGTTLAARFIEDRLGRR